MFQRFLSVSRGVLVGAFILPHGALVLNPDPIKEPESYKLHKGMKECGKQIKSLKPDIILLTTPHGVSLTNSLAIYTNKYVSGSAAWLGKYTEYELKNIECDSSKANSLLKWINSQYNSYPNNKYPVDGYRYIYTEFEAPINWGEVIPLWFIQDILKFKDTENMTNDDTTKKAKIIIMSSRLANTFYDQNPTDINDLNNIRFIGENILDWCDNLDERIVIITSGDLSHRHKNDIDQRYAASNDAKPFDDLIDLWINTMDTNYLNKAAALQFTASSCGLYGFILFDGVLQKWKRMYQLKSLKNELVVPATHPTYYGMTCASFLFDQS